MRNHGRVIPPEWKLPRYFWQETLTEPRELSNVERVVALCEMRINDSRSLVYKYSVSTRTIPLTIDDRDTEGGNE